MRLISEIANGSLRGDVSHLDLSDTRIYETWGVCGRDKIVIIPQTLKSFYVMNVDEEINFLNTEYNIINSSFKEGIRYALNQKIEPDSMKVILDVNTQKESDFSLLNHIDFELFQLTNHVLAAYVIGKILRLKNSDISYSDYFNNFSKQMNIYQNIFNNSSPLSWIKRFSLYSDSCFPEISKLENIQKEISANLKNLDHILELLPLIRGANHVRIQ